MCNIDTVESSMHCACWYDGDPCCRCGLDEDDYDAEEECPGYDSRDYQDDDFYYLDEEEFYED